MLLDGTAEVVDLHEQPELSFVAVDRVSGFIGIVGRPPPEAIVEAAALSACRDQAVCEVRAQSHVAGALPGWKTEEAPLCLLADGASLSEIPREE